MFIDFDLENIGRASGGAIHLVNSRQVQGSRGLRPFAGRFLVSFFFLGGRLPQLLGGDDIVLSIVVKTKQGHRVSLPLHNGHCFSYTTECPVTAFIGANDDGSCTKRSHGGVIYGSITGNIEVQFFNKKYLWFFLGFYIVCGFFLFSWQQCTRLSPTRARWFGMVQCTKSGRLGAATFSSTGHNARGTHLR